MEPILRGKGFGNIPDDAVGIGATSNDDPLEYVNTTNAALILQIAEKTDIQIRMTQDMQYSHTYAAYLGAIVSADRQTIYWVNTSKPLP